MNARISRGFRQPLLVAACALLALTRAAGTASAEDLQYEGRVVVGPDGNGWVAARFPTTVGGDDVTYYLDVWIGCGEESAVKALGVTLNGEVVFRKASLSSIERTKIALHLVGTSDNDIMVSGEGERGAAARFAIVAVAADVK